MSTKKERNIEMKEVLTLEISRDEAGALLDYLIESSYPKNTLLEGISEELENLVDSEISELNFE